MKSFPSMIYAGVHFKTCPVEYREAWNLVAHSDTVYECLSQITSDKIEFVNIGTCNRFDICLFGYLTTDQIIQLFFLLAKDYFKKNNFLTFIEQPEKILSFLKIFYDTDALQHLMKVTASLDSLVLGEQQILGQIKSAYVQCYEKGYAGKTAHKIFSHNFRVAKKIRSETDIGKNSLSIAYAATEMINQVFESLKDKKILIIGAGEMAKIIIKNLAIKGVRNLHIANRTIENIKNISNGMSIVNEMSIELALNQLHLYDICLIAIGGENVLISKELLTSMEKKRKGNLTLFIDVSVPRKIMSENNTFENLYIFNVDDLEKIMEKNKSLRQESACQAEEIIQAEIQNYIIKIEQKRNLKQIAQMHQWLKQTIDYEVKRHLYDLARGKNVNPEIISEAAAKKIVSHMALKTRHQHKLEKPTGTVSEMVEYLFNLSHQKEKQFLKENSEDNLIPFKKIKGSSY